MTEPKPAEPTPKPRRRPPKAPRRQGRPETYQARYANQARRMALLGATDQDLAATFEVDDATIDQWKRKHPRFLQALKAGKEEADCAVAASLYRKALGFRVKAVKIMQDKDGNSFEHEFQEYYPPDTTAAIFWLKNRRPRHWRADPMVSLEVNDQTLRLPAVIIEEARRIAMGEGS